MFSNYTYNGAHGRWRQISPEEFAQLSPQQMEAADMLFVTVLSIDEGEDPHIYRGPFYIDIDAADIDQACDVMRSIVNKMLKNGVPENDIKLWASGKKGFHLTIDQAAFADEESHKDLPHIYKRMAEKIAPDAKLIDKSVYSRGRGRMWRIENIRRPDNGKYKVPITVDQLMGMDAEKYAVITSAPVYMATTPAPTRSTWLSTLYTQAKFQEEQVPPPQPMFIDPEIEESMKGELPACMKNLLAGENIKESAGFNAVSLQMAKAVAYFAPNDKKRLEEQFVQNVKGDNYNTVEKRRVHFNTAFNQAARSNAYAFNCDTMRSVLGKAPCKGCPLYDTENRESDASRKVEPGTEEMEIAGLEVTRQGYCFVGAKGERRLVSNFTLRFRKEYLEVAQSTKEQRRVCLIAEVHIKGEYAGTVQIEESHWTSKASFLSALLGLQNAAFYGSDTDVQKMKGALLSGNLGMEQVVRVHTCGVLRTVVNNQNVFAYVEPGWSIDSTGQENRYMVSGKISASPKLHSAADVAYGDPELLKVIDSMTRVNDPLVVALTLGWYSACFIKPHFEAIQRQFPLLSLSGNAGAGKTVTAAIFSCLHGVDYILEEGPITLSTVTHFAIWSFISSSTSVPRLLDEYNRSKMNKKQYNEISEALKGAWSSQSVSRGTISGRSVHGAGRVGAHTVEIPLSGPIVFMSEQSPEIPALVDRSIQVSMSREGRNKPGMTAALDYVHENRDKLRPLAKYLNMKALTTDVENVKEIMGSFYDLIPLTIGDRPHYSYRVVLTGLRFLKSALLEKGIDLSERFQELEQAVIDSVVGNESEIVAQKRRSEIDLVLMKMAVMASLSESGSQEWLVSGRHYVASSDWLILDPVVAHALYVRYMNTMERHTPVIDSPMQFKQLLGHEDYCETVSAPYEGFANGRPVARLSLQKMTKKGIDVSLFTKSGA